jgi:arginine/lysine/ornithine decarboxylase
MISDNQKVYVTPDPHVSIPNVCKVLGLELVETLDFARIDDALCVIITYPTYFGECIETHSIIERAHDRGIPVFFDNAHGAHLYFSKKLPDDPMSLGADCAVCSTHKTLPCLGQTAVICRNFDSLIPAEILQTAINTFQTTSPSYLLMSSIDEGVAYMVQHGEEELSALIEKATELTEIIPDDKTKIIVNIDKKQALIDNNITWERIDDDRILLLPSVWNSDEDFDALRRAIK